MACDSAPTEPPLSDAELSPGHGEQADRGELLGPVTLTRHVKDDGRALILYARAAADETTGGQPR